MSAGGDGGYGLLFTEADVRWLVEEAARRGAMAHDDLGIADDVMTEALGERADALTFPVSEPLFLLRARDPVAPVAVAEYVEVAEGTGAPTELVERAHNAEARMRRWQREHPDRVTVRA
jgi:hypothetical protein